jgi:hypothetical protein
VLQDKTRVCDYIFSFPCFPNTALLNKSRAVNNRRRRGICGNAPQLAGNLLHFRKRIPAPFVNPFRLFIRQCALVHKSVRAGLALLAEKEKFFCTFGAKAPEDWMQVQPPSTSDSASAEKGSVWFHGPSNAKCIAADHVSCCRGAAKVSKSLSFPKSRPERSFNSDTVI